MDQPTIITVIMTVLTGIGSFITMVVRWVAKALEECKAEHREARFKIEELHVELKDVSKAVGKLEGALLYYQEQNPDKTVDK